MKRQSAATMFGSGFLRAALIGGLLGMLCFAGEVKTLTGKDADFSRYKTYEWLPPKIHTPTGIVEDDPVIAPLIKQAVNDQLAKKGLREVVSGGDLQVATLALAEWMPQVEALVFSTGTQPNWGTAVTTVGRYNKQGSLFVNLIDTRTKLSAWVGMATESLADKPGSGQKKIAGAAAKMFKKYPLPK
jgi:hypothetical protein